MTITAIITAAREITGYKTSDSAGDTTPKDPAIQAALQKHIRDLNKLFGGTAGIKETQFTAVIGQQDYLVSTYVGNDVAQVQDVLRSGAYTPDFVIGAEDTLVGNGAFNGDDVISAGLQDDVFRTIVDQRRSERADRYSWELAPGNKIRLFPPPASAEIIAVRYTTTAADTSTLDASAEPAMVEAACMEIFNLVLNRLTTLPIKTEWHAQALRGQIDVAKQQRDQYKARYAQEVAMLSKG